MEHNDINNSKITESDSDFFNNIVAEKHPDLLIDVCDYWLNQFYFKVPGNVSMQNRAGYPHQLRIILKMLESRNSIILYKDKNDDL